jgi:hypothetical protein
MSDPAIEAAQSAFIREGWGDVLQLSEGHLAVAAAREALKPIRDAMVVIKERYERVHGYMLDADTSAEMSRHASELAGLMFGYNAIAPLVYTSEEMA